MEVLEAFRILGLPSTCTNQELRERFRELAQEAHPDLGGTPGELAQLTNAYEVATATKSSQALILSPRDLISVTSLIVAEQQHARETSRQLVKQIASRRSTPFKMMRRIVALIGATSGAAAILGSKIVPMFDEILPISFGTTRWLAYGAALCGVAYILFLAMAETAERIVLEFDNILNDKSEYLDIVYEMLNEMEAGKSWSRSELEAGVNKWLRVHGGQGGSISSLLSYLFDQTSNCELAKVVGASDVLRLLLSRGMQHGVLRSSELVEDDRLVVKYTLGNGVPNVGKTEAVESEPVQETADNTNHQQA